MDCAEGQIHFVLLRRRRRCHRCSRIIIQESFANADPTAADIVGRDRLFRHLNSYQVESMLAAATRLTSVLKTSDVSPKLNVSENDQDVSVVPPAVVFRKSNQHGHAHTRLQDRRLKMNVCPRGRAVLPLHFFQRSEKKTLALRARHEKIHKQNSAAKDTNQLLGLGTRIHR